MQEAIGIIIKNDNTVANTVTVKEMLKAAGPIGMCLTKKLAYDIVLEKIVPGQLVEEHLQRKG